MVAFPSDEFAGTVEVRPGRHIYIRKVLLAVASQDGGANRKDNTSAVYHNNHIQMIFVHGLGGTQLQFQMLMQSLYEQMLLDPEKMRITCWLYDHVGCGQSPPLPNYTDYTHEQIKDDFKAFLLYTQQQQSSIPNHTILVGHSYGPSIFVPLLTSAANNVGPLIIPNRMAIILIATSVRDCSYLSLPDGGHPILRYLPVSILNCIQSSLTEDFIRKAVHPHHTTLQHLIRNSSSQNNMFVIQCYHCHTKWMTIEQLQHCIGSNNISGNPSNATTLPLLIVHGVADGITPIQCAQYIHNHLTTSSSSNAHLCVIEEASHLVMMEQPQETAITIFNFIDKLQVDIK